MRVSKGRWAVGGADRLTIHYFATCWDEEEILPRFLAHHRPLFDRIVVVDDGSADRSLKLLHKESNVDASVRSRPSDVSYIELNTVFYNEAWKESRGRADWVVVGNLDEFTYCHDLRGYLAACKRLGVTVVPVLGFEMVGRDRVPSGHQLLRSIRRGASEADLCRFAIFNPDAIEEIGYGHGRHLCAPVGDIVLPERDRVLNLHFKRVGLEETFLRMKAQNQRRVESDLRMGLGHHYSASWDRYLAEWARLEAESIDVLEWYRRDLPYPQEVWWRSPRARDLAFQAEVVIQAMKASEHEHTPA